MVRCTPLVQPSLGTAWSQPRQLCRRPDRSTLSAWLLRGPCPTAQQADVVQAIAGKLWGWRGGRLPTTNRPSQWRRALNEGKGAAAELAQEERSKQLEEEEDSWKDNPSTSQSGLLRDERFLRRVAQCESAEAVLALLEERSGEGGGGVVSTAEAATLILACLAEGNSGLAFSVVEAMRAEALQRRVQGREAGGEGSPQHWWRWAAPDVKVAAALVRGLAASLRVSDALQALEDVCRRGVPRGEEVPFGRVVGCPTCRNAPLAVVQPQFGVQLVPCSKCRYQYELMSGDVVSVESEAVSAEASPLQRVLQLLPFRRRPPCKATHSMLVRAPDGVARTHRFATPSAEVPAQEGERVTVVSAAPASAAQGGLGPLRPSTRAPGWAPSEPMSLLNHNTRRVSPLLRPPPKVGEGLSRDLGLVVPAALLLAGGDAATALVDPSLPRLVAGGVAGVLVVGAAANAFVFPRLNQVGEGRCARVAVRQDLLGQHAALQQRLEELTAAAAQEVRMLARMCQLQNKMEAVGEPAAYSARMERVRSARAGLDQRLAARLELIDSYAKVASMIEIEVEMDDDVLAAEAAGAAQNIADQIEKLMEVDSLQKEWQLQAEASEEVERLLRQAPPLAEG